MLKTARLLWHAFFLCAVPLMIYNSQEGKTESVYPDKKIKVVIPFTPGGGTDTFVRFIDKTVREKQLLPQNFIIVNKPGGATTVGTNFVKGAKADGYTILCLHEALLISKASGNSPYGPDDFEPIAATGEVGLMFLTRKGEYKDLNDFLAKAKEKTLTLGMSQNTPTHYAGLMLRKLSGADIRLVSVGGGAKRLTALQGGHVDASVFSVSEYMRFKEMGLGAIAYLDHERHSHPEVNIIPTAKEQGFPIIYTNLQYWWAPKGTRQEIIDVLAAALEKAMEDKDVNMYFNKLQIAPTIITGDKLKKRIAAKMAGFEMMKKGKKSAELNLEKWCLGFIAFFSVLIFIKRPGKQKKPNDSAGRNDLAIWSVIFTILYTVILQSGIVDFRISTSLYIFACVCLLSKVSKKTAIYLLQSSIIFSVTLYYVFQSIFDIQLP